MTALDTPGRAVAAAAPSGARYGVRQAGPLALAGLGANAANLAVTVVVARLLSVRGYGSLNELVSVFLVLSMPGSALLVAVVRRVTGWEASGQGDRVAAWAARVRRAGLVAAAAVALAGWLARGFVADQLSLPSSAGVTATLAAGAVWGLLCVERGLLQSRRSYGRLARNLAVEGAARTIFTLGLVAAGWGVGGATAGLLAGVAAAVVDARLSVRAADRAVAVPVAVPEVAVGAASVAEVAVPPSDARDRRRLLVDLGVALSALALIAVLQSADVVLVGRMRPGRIGAYAAVSVACKAVVFAALVLAGFLLPEAATRWNRGEHALHELTVALGVLAVPAGGLFALSVVAPHRLLAVVFGARLTSAAAAFAPLAAAMALLGATVLFTHYLLGVGHRRVVGLLAAAAVAVVVVIAAGGGSPVATAWRDLALQAGLAGVAGAMVLTVHLPGRRHPVP